MLSRHVHSSKTKFRREKEVAHPPSYITSVTYIHDYTYQGSDDRCAFRSLRFSRHRRSRRRIPRNNCSLALFNRWWSRFSYDRLGNSSYAAAAAAVAVAATALPPFARRKYQVAITSSISKLSSGGIIHRRES
jgi:hypothetical protein